MQERLIGVARDLESALHVQVSLPAPPKIEDLFDQSTSGRGDEPEASAVTDDGVDETSDAEQLIVIGEAAPPAYEHLPEDEGPVLDPSYEELWEGTDAMRFDLPDIPALDLDWGEDDDSA